MDARESLSLARGWRAVVPGCPDWTLADLVRHLGEVQHFWAWIVRTGAADPSAYPEPARRPEDELLAWGVAQSAELDLNVQNIGLIGISNAGLAFTPVA